MQKELDFYLLGKQIATEALESVKEKGLEVKELYGDDAKLEFEIGVASAIGEYEFVEDFYSEDINLDNISATTDYGIPNERNNSYFGGTGVGKQYVIRNGVRVFNDPKKK